MTSKKRINKYKPAANTTSLNVMNDQNAAGFSHRRHSWFGAILSDSAERGYSSANGIKDVKKLSIDELDTKPPENSSLIEKAVHVLGFSSSSQQQSENLPKNMKIDGHASKVTKSRSLNTAEYARVRTKPATQSTADDASKRSSMMNSLLTPPIGTSCPNLTRLTQRRATVHYSSTGRPSLMDHKRRTAYSSLRPNEIRAMEQFKGVCRDYIVYKLSQHNLIDRVALDRGQSKEKWLFLEILFIAEKLQRIKKNCFDGIASKTGVSIRSEETLRKIFFEISTEIITTEVSQSNELKRTETHHYDLKSVNENKHSPLLAVSSRSTEVTWGRLCAVLLVAGSLAIDCVQQGQCSLVNYIVEYVGDFAREEDILNWIVDQGGWEALRQLTQGTNTSDIETSDSSGYSRITNTALLFFVCTIGAVFAAFSAANFTD